VSTLIDAPPGVLRPVPVRVETMPADWRGSLLDLPLGRARRAARSAAAPLHVIDVYPTLHLADSGLDLPGDPLPVPQRRGPVAIAAVTATLGLAAASVAGLGVIALLH
jgi:hypothetical protein